MLEGTRTNKRNLPAPPRRFALLACAALTAFVVPVVANATGGPLDPLVRHVSAHVNGKAAFSIDTKALGVDRSSLPIGVFDSGIGGFTVMEALLTLDAHDNRTLRPGADGVPDFAGEKFIYFGDQANMPYGNYPPSGRADFLRELILKSAVFLLGRRYSSGGKSEYDKPPVKAIVIACNTATAYGIDDIRAALRQWKLDIPVIGVVEAGARAASEALRETPGTGAVAVMATVGTCESGAYPRAIGRFLGMAGRPAPVTVQHGSVGLAGALEGNRAFVAGSLAGRKTNPSYAGPAVGNAKAPIEPSLREVYGFDMDDVLGEKDDPATWQLNSAANYARYDIAALAENYRRGGGIAPISTVVLGCTHYPMAKAEISGAFERLRTLRLADGREPYRELIATNISFVDPAEFTARDLFRELARSRMRADRASTNAPELLKTFVSVPNSSCKETKLAPTGALDTGYKYGRLPGNLETEDTVCVPLGEAPSAKEGLSKLLHALPRVSSALGLGS